MLAVDRHAQFIYAKKEDFYRGAWTKNNAWWSRGLNCFGYNWWKKQRTIIKQKSKNLSQSEKKTLTSTNLTLSEEDALKAQIFGCWSIPLGLPYNENLLVRIKLELKPDGTVIKSEILDHARMNKPGQGFYKVLAESALRAIKLCQPLRVPTKGYERWKNLQLNFDAREMLEGW